MGDLSGRVALVTGGARGIGKAIVEELADAGCRVVVNYRSSQAAAEELVASLRERGREAIAVRASIAEEGTGHVLVRKALDAFGSVDILVNNAGINRDATIRKMSDQQLTEVLETNLIGTHRVTRAAIEPMCEARWGRIVTIASFVGEKGNFGQSNYAASKAGLIGWTKAIALELARYEVTANCVCPGFVETGMVQGIPAEVRERLLAGIPLGRFGQPEEIARAVRFLVESGYATGSCLDINGGGVHVSSPGVGGAPDGGEVRVGDRAERTHAVTDEAIHAFADATGDRNPLHLSDAFAASTRFGGRIAHGLLTAGYLSALIAAELPGPGTVYLSQTLAFRAPVRPGDAVRCAVEVVAVDAEHHRATLRTTADVGGTLVLEGEAVVRLPDGPSDRPSGSSPDTPPLDCRAMDLARASATDVAGALRRRECSAIEVLEAVEQRADVVAAALNPFSERLGERARASAEAADRALARGEGGALCGVPATVKDTIWMAGLRSTDGSRALADFTPTESCAAVERLEAAGAVVWARTTNPEFCYYGITESPLLGVTSNPWDVGRVPGGSSGGAGAACAAGCGPLHLGTDGGGSIRIPAAFCGLVGMKPTFGLVPKDPEFTGWKTLTVLGPIARTVADARLMLGVIAGIDARDRHSLPSVDVRDAGADLAVAGLRLVVSADLGGAVDVDDDVRAAFEHAVAALAAAGATIVRDDPGLPASHEPWTVVAAVDAWASDGHLLAQRDVLDPRSVAFMEYGAAVSLADYLKAQYAREPIHRAYGDLLARHDAAALLTPSLGCQAFAHGTTSPLAIGGRPVDPVTEEWCGFLVDANLAGLPACAVPTGLGADGLPVGLQVLGRRADDGVVLAVAEQVERVLGLALAPPALAPVGGKGGA